VSAGADSGDVTVDLPGGRYAIDADADSGDVGVDGVIRDDTAPRHVEAHADSGDVTVRGAEPGGRAYQCTPFMRFAIATCSTDAFSSGSFSPFAAAESGKTLNAMWRIWSTALGASA
jgi:hypothetical protein